MYDLAITNSTILTMDKKQRILKNATLLVRGNKIVEITNSPLRFQARRTLSAQNKIVMPGFVNPHTHGLHILLRGLPQKLPLYDWLSKIIYPHVNAYKRKDARKAIKLFCKELIQSGITTICDGTDLAHRDDLVEESLKSYFTSGLRVYYARYFSDCAPDEYSSANESTSSALKKIEELMRKNNHSDSLLTVIPGINEPHFVSAQGCQKALQLAQKYNTPLTTHIAEVEEDYLLDNQSIINWLETHQILNPRLILSHCVWLNSHDLSKINRYQSKITWQPVTNRFLGDGTAPIKEALEQKVTIGIGTDDANLVDRVNMFQELRTAKSVMAEKYGESGFLTDQKLLEIATIGGAQVLGLEKEIGSIEKNKKADLLILDLPTEEDIYSEIIEKGQPSLVQTVIVNGKVLTNKKTK